MHKIWTGLKLLGRWLGPALSLLAVWLFRFPLSPFFGVSGLVALVGAIVSTIGWFVGRRSDCVKSERFLAAAAVIRVAYFGLSTLNGPSGLFVIEE